MSCSELTAAYLAAWGEDDATSQNLEHGDLRHCRGHCVQAVAAISAGAGRLTPAWLALMRLWRCWEANTGVGRSLVARVVTSTDESELWALLDTLSQVGDAGLYAEAALSLLAREDLDASTRGFCMERAALARTESPDVLKLIRAATRAPSATERFWACYALGALGSSSDEVLLRSLLDDGTPIAGYGTVGSEAASAIEAIHHRSRPDGHV